MGPCSLDVSGRRWLLRRLEQQQLRILWLYTLIALPFPAPLVRRAPFRTCFTEECQARCVILLCQDQIL